MKPGKDSTKVRGVKAAALLAWGVMLLMPSLTCAQQPAAQLLLRPWAK